MIVLDTHILIWWATGDISKLSTAAHAAIQTELAEGEIVISAISSWELAALVAKGRIALSMDTDAWLDAVQQLEAVRFMPVDNQIAVKSVTLPGEFHKDTADRMIVATARQLSAPLVTADEKIRTYPHVRTIW